MVFSSASLLRYPPRVHLPWWVLFAPLRWPMTQRTLQDLPGTAEALIELLDELFPARCPGEHESERAIWKYAGKRALIDNLVTCLAAQKESDPYRVHG